MPWASTQGIKNWEQLFPDTGIGEVIGRGRYYRGTDVFGARGAGICGTAAQWLDGCSPFDPLPPLDPLTGLPRCCGRGVDVLTGGSGAGGGSIYVGVIFASGGSGGGGKGVTVWQSAGGTATGGVSVAGVLLVASLGGTSAGGFSLTTFGPGVSLGGSAAGGAGVALPVLVVAAGGSAAGGAGQHTPAVVSFGGSAAGGPAAVQIWPLYTFTGGSAAGGDQLKQPQVFGGLGPCLNYISSKLVLNVTTRIGSCTCMPTVLHFRWTGGRWDCVTSAGSCSGTGHDTASWYFFGRTTPTGGYLLFDYQDNLCTSFICGPPFSAVISRSSPAYCTGVGSAWQGTFTEE